MRHNKDLQGPRPHPALRSSAISSRIQCSDALCPREHVSSRRAHTGRGSPGLHIGSLLALPPSKPAPHRSDQPGPGVPHPTAPRTPPASSNLMPLSTLSATVWPLAPTAVTGSVSSPRNAGSHQRCFSETQIYDIPPTPGCSSPEGSTCGLPSAAVKALQPPPQCSNPIPQPARGLTAPRLCVPGCFLPESSAGLHWSCEARGPRHLHHENLQHQQVSLAAPPGFTLCTRLADSPDALWDSQVAAPAAASPTWPHASAWTLAVL